MMSPPTRSDSLVVSDDLSSLHHELDSLKLREVCERVAGNGNDDGSSVLWRRRLSVVQQTLLSICGANVTESRSETLEYRNHGLARPI